MSEAPQKWWRRILSFLEDLDTLTRMWTVLTGFIVTWYALAKQVMPELSTNPVQYWAASGAVFLGTVVGTVTSLRLYDLAKLRVLRFWRPHRPIITSAGGPIAAVTITHSGEPAAWEVRMKIVRTLDGSTNPNPLQDQCFLYRDGRTYRSLALKEGESAHITLAAIGSSEWSNDTWLLIKHAGHGTQIPDDGVIIELEVKAEPPMSDGLVRSCYDIRRVTASQNPRKIISRGRRENIEITGVSCD